MFNAVQRHAKTIPAFRLLSFNRISPLKIHPFISREFKYFFKPQTHQIPVILLAFKMPYNARIALNAVQVLAKIKHVSLNAQ